MITSDLTQQGRFSRGKTLAAAIAVAVLSLLGLLGGCMRTAQLDDPALKPFENMYSVDRAKYGFTPLPKTGRVLIEGKSPHGDYDAMLHFGGNPSRTIAFRWDGKAYQWLGEKEEFEGPQTYETASGRFHERVVITYYKAPAYGASKGLQIQYRGPESLRPPTPQTNWSLTVAEVSPLLKKWGLRE